MAEMRGVNPQHPRWEWTHLHGHKYARSTFTFDSFIHSFASTLSHTHSGRHKRTDHTHGRSKFPAPSFLILQTCAPPCFSLSDTVHSRSYLISLISHIRPPCSHSTNQPEHVPLFSILTIECIIRHPHGDGWTHQRQVCARVEWSMSSVDNNTLLSSPPWVNQHPKAKK